MALYPSGVRRLKACSSVVERCRHVANVEGSIPSAPTSPEQRAEIAKQKHSGRQRPGHHSAEWEGLSDLMREELILQEKLLLKK